MSQPGVLALREKTADICYARLLENFEPLRANMSYFGNTYSDTFVRSSWSFMDYPEYLLKQCTGFPFLDFQSSQLCPYELSGTENLNDVWPLIQDQVNCVDDEELPDNVALHCATNITFEFRTAGAKDSNPYGYEPGHLLKRVPNVLVYLNSIVNFRYGITDSQFARRGVLAYPMFPAASETMLDQESYLGTYPPWAAAQPMPPGTLIAKYADLGGKSTFDDRSDTLSKGNFAVQSLLWDLLGLNEPECFAELKKDKDCTVADDDRVGYVDKDKTCTQTVGNRKYPSPCESMFFLKFTFLESSIAKALDYDYKKMQISATWPQARGNTQALFIE